MFTRPSCHRPHLLKHNKITPRLAMNDIAQRIHDIKANLPGNVELVAVSKFHPKEAIMEAYEGGHRVFGESRANELVEKARSLPDDIEWHFIGHLQTNKVSTVVPYVKMIQSVDSERLLIKINNAACDTSRQVDVLLQLHVALEETKFGFTLDEIDALLGTGLLDRLNMVKIRGVMGMASNVDDENRIRQDFMTIKSAFDALKGKYFADDNDFNIISMGMSHDYETAVECGSNMVRIGTTIFGEREY